MYVLDIGKLVLTFVWRGKRARIVDTLLKEKNQVKGPALSDLKIHWKL